MIPDRLTVLDAVARVAGTARGRTYVAGCSGEPLSVAQAFRIAPDLAAGMTFHGVWIPGVNRTDWAGLHPAAKAETIFLSPDLRTSFEARRTAFRPLSYVQTARALAREASDAAFCVVSPPDEADQVSLGVSADFSEAALRLAGTRVALVNPHMPAPPNAPKLPLSWFDIVVEDDTPLLTVDDAALDPAFALIAGHIAEQIPDRATLQFGLGKVQAAILRALSAKRDLRIHSGMVSDPVLDLLDSPVLSREANAITTGVAIGSPRLYRMLAEDPRVRFAPVSMTHDLRTLADLPRFCAINSVIEVDLFGQANAEFLDGRQISGAGGLVDFLRGARYSEGGLAITALLSTAKAGTISRIVPRLSPDAVTIARGDMGLVVTEHGVADLRTADIDARARALITIAAPAHRAHLEASWDAMRSAM
jgi:acyl-CoA hydrolase